jgi:hypothetical protein
MLFLPIVAAAMLVTDEDLKKVDAEIALRNSREIARQCISKSAAELARYTDESAQAVASMAVQDCIQLLRPLVVGNDVQWVIDAFEHEYRLRVAKWRANAKKSGSYSGNP